MANKTDPIDEILDLCGMNGPWEALGATGLANRIYATKDVVIRVANDHQEALKDAKTESIAAPVAYAAGVLTPRLLVFDETEDDVARFDGGSITPRCRGVQIEDEGLPVFTHAPFPGEAWRRLKASVELDQTIEEI